MSIVYDLNQLETPLQNPVLTIGNFDGVHLGHLALFDKVKERAKAIMGTSAVMTFEPHPLKVMAPENGPPLITPTSQKLKLMSKAGMDMVFCVPFTRSFASISAQDFVHNILINKIGIKEIVVGYDYSFGHMRQGGIELLQKMGRELSFVVHVVSPITVEGTLVSSTSIRKLVREGNLQLTKKLLGRNYQVCGKVVTGMNRGGRLLGFPTANLELVDELIPRVGVYAVKVLIDGRVYDGVTNVGYNPTFQNSHFSVETHILDFSQDLVGKTIRVNFIQRLRDEKAFKRVEDLAEQIGEDVRRAREIFKEIAPSDPQ
jgi:riboflavin kinase/FMN adenylyltransferase